MRLTSKNEKETHALAARLAKRAVPGVICLSGPLGGGKTTFVRGFLRALGHRGVVTSPTFALVNEYPRVTPRVYHMDLYRIEEETAAAGLGLEEYFEDERAVSLVEWPEVAEAFLPVERLEISFDHIRSGGRKINLKAHGAHAQSILERLER